MSLILLGPNWYFTCHVSRRDVPGTVQAMPKLQAHRATVAMCALALAFGQGCARTEPLHPTGGSSLATNQKLPFHATAAREAAAANLDVPREQKSPGGLPFHNESSSRIIPLGTLLTVQLEGSLSAAKPSAGDSFLASVAEPFTVDGHLVVDRGTEVTGRVESTSPGYFRLILTAISVSGRQVAVRTSSLFARGNPAVTGVRVPKGRHLTFRLTAPVFLPESDTKRPSSVPATE